MSVTREVKGKTPAGGVRAVLFFSDSKGEPVDEKKASLVRVVEYGSDGQPIKSTYGSLEEQQSNPDELDEPTDNADEELDSALPAGKKPKTLKNPIVPPDKAPFEHLTPKENKHQDILHEHQSKLVDKINKGVATPEEHKQFSKIRERLNRLADAVESRTEQHKKHGEAKKAAKEAEKQKGKEKKDKGKPTANELAVPKPVTANPGASIGSLGSLGSAKPAAIKPLSEKAAKAAKWEADQEGRRVNKENRMKAADPVHEQLQKRVESPHRLEGESNEEHKMRVTLHKEIKPLSGGGVNLSKKLVLNDGTTGIWKPLHGEMGGLRDSIQPGTYYRREAAASKIAKHVGMGDLVPRTVIRTVNGHLGSHQEWMHGAKEAVGIEGAEKYDGPKDAARAATLDYLIGNTDRHEGNWMIHGNKLHLIDHGLSFPENHNEMSSELINHAKAKEHTVQPLQGEWEDVEKHLKNHGIEDKAINATKRRWDELKEKEGKSFREMKLTQ